MATNACANGGETHSNDEIDTEDVNWYRSIALAGLALAMASANAASDPGILPLAIAIGLGVVFLGLVKIVTPED